MYAVLYEEKTFIHIVIKYKMKSQSFNLLFYFLLRELSIN
jgi:hypothetical protein